MLNNLLSFASVMQTIGYVLIAILILLVMITVHEFGHYVSGKIFGFGIEEFAIGFGPKIFKKDLKNGEVFSIRCLPLGGFCSFKGEDQEDDDPTAFNNKKPWQRIIVLVSGAFMNYLLALLIIMLTFACYGQSKYYVKQMDENVTVSEYTLQEGDVILAINGKNVYNVSDMMSAYGGRKAGETVKLKVIRDGVKQVKEITLITDTNFKNLEDTDTLLTSLGVNSLYSKRVRVGFFGVIGGSVEYSIKTAGTIFKFLGQLFTGAIGLNSMGGTITTIGITADAIKTGGLFNLLTIASYIGVNLAVFNLLPIPALDGSRVIFTIVEWIRKKPLNRNVEAIIHTVGLIVLFAFAILVDLLHLF